MTAPSNSSPYSWRFLAWWVGVTGAFGLAGALVDLALSGGFLVGLALGIVLGSLLAIAVQMRRSRAPAAPPLPDLNARLLGWVIVSTALGALLYLAAGWAGVPMNFLFPWDGLGLLALCSAAALLLRRGQSFWASSCLLGGFFLPIAFNAQFYGMASPVNALYLLGVLVTGLVLGSNGFFGGLAAISTLTALFAIGEALGEWDPLYPPITLAQAPGVVLFWWAVYGAGAWLSWLFARTLERAVHTARGQTVALAHTLNALTPASSLDVVLKQTLAAIAEQLGAAYAVLWLHDAARGTISLRLAHVNGEVVTPERLPDAPPPTHAQDLPLWRELARDRRPIVIQDVANDPRLKFRALSLTQGIQTILHVPLLLGEAAVGFFTVNSLEPRRYSVEELEFAQALAQQVTLTMQLARLAEQNQQTAVLAERNRMAREIHDTLAQGFTGIVVQLEAADDVLRAEPAQASQHLARARALARESLAEARRSVYALRPQSLEHKPLPIALRDSVTALTADAPLHVEVHVPGDWPALPPELESDLLRLGQEAVTNVLRHAEAGRLRLALRAGPGQIALEVQDDGRGFDPAGNGARPGGLGLVGMRERAARHGGALTLTSALGEGTLVQCVIPIP